MIKLLLILIRKIKTIIKINKIINLIVELVLLRSSKINHQNQAHQQLIYIIRTNSKITKIIKKPKLIIFFNSSSNKSKIVQAIILIKNRLNNNIFSNKNKIWKINKLMKKYKKILYKMRNSQHNSKKYLRRLI